ncbi:ABC transporter permease [Puteibacter caeruleilacunae]|nr:ABC transporter permease [Puteibacter caeruleilacunae]
MIKHYFKSTINALWKRKWFSFLTLFSIALSLIVVTCVATIWNMWSTPMAPEVNKERTLYLDAKVWIKENNRSIHQINAADVLPKSFFVKGVHELTTPEMSAVYYSQGVHDFMRNNKTKRIHLITTDANFFKIFDFEFIAGKPYHDEASRSPQYPCVITKELALYYFGNIDCLGKIIKNRSRQYKVTGIINKPVASQELSFDIYYQINPDEAQRYSNWYDVAFLCSSKADQEALDAELQKIAKTASDKHQKQRIELNTLSSVMNIIIKRFQFERDLWPIYATLILIVLIIPSLCLIDVLRNNQAHRTHEMGIHRAFGASKGRMASMLLVDNLVVTTIGGIVGLALSIIFFSFISEDSWTDTSQLFFNWSAIAYYMLVFLIIGFIAGILPAKRLSKLHIINALNQVEND